MHKSGCCRYKLEIAELGVVDGVHVEMTLQYVVELSRMSKVTGHICGDIEGRRMTVWSLDSDAEFSMPQVGLSLEASTRPSPVGPKHI
jgi:hypothetical protein